MLLSNPIAIRKYLEQGSETEHAQPSKRQLIFENRGSEAVGVFWISWGDAGAKHGERLQFSLDPNAEKSVEGYSGHTFVARTSEGQKEYRLLWVAPGGQGPIRVVFDGDNACVGAAQETQQAKVLASLKSLMHGNKSYVANVTVAIADLA